MNNLFPAQTMTETVRIILLTILKQNNIFGESLGSLFHSKHIILYGVDIIYYTFKIINFVPNFSAQFPLLQV
jgi:hypothetical protein